MRALLCNLCVNDLIFFPYAVVSLTYEIVGRPNSTRPITGDTVVFTCEVEGTVVTWLTSAIDSGQRDIVDSSSMLGVGRTDSRSGECFFFPSQKNIELHQAPLPNYMAKQIIVVSCHQVEPSLLSPTRVDILLPYSPSRISSQGCSTTRRYGAMTVPRGLTPRCCQQQVCNQASVHFKVATHV